MNPFRPPCWLKLLSLAFLVCCGCTTTKTAEQKAHLELQTATETDAVQHKEQAGTEHRGPDTGLDLTFAPLALNEPPQAVKDGLPPHGALLHAHVTQTGPIDTSWMALADGFRGSESDTGLKADSQAKSEAHVAPAASCAFTGGLYAALLVAGVAGLLLFRKDAVAGLIKRLWP